MSPNSTVLKLPAYKIEYNIIGQDKKINLNLNCFHSDRKSHIHIHFNQSTADIYMCELKKVSQHSSVAIVPLQEFKSLFVPHGHVHMFRNIVMDKINDNT